MPHSKFLVLHSDWWLGERRWKIRCDGLNLSNTVFVRISRTCKNWQQKKKTIARSGSKRRLLGDCILSNYCSAQHFVRLSRAENSHK